MIESSPLTNNLLKIDVESSIFEELVNDIENTPYTEERTYGFVPEEFKENIISAYLIVKTPTKIRSFNEKSQEVEERDISRTSLVPFRIDLTNNFLEVFSNKQNVQQLRTRISQIASWDLSLENITLDLEELFEKLNNGRYEVCPNALRINNFSLNEYTNGNCYLEVYDKKELNRLLRKYGQDVSYMGAEFEIRKEKITVGFYKSGSVRLYSKSEEDEEILEYLKNIFKEIEV